MPDDAPEELSTGQAAPDWSAARELMATSATQFLGLPSEPGEAILVIGQVSHPVVFGTPEMVERQSREMTSIPVLPIAKVSLSRKNLAELREVVVGLERALDQIAASAEGKA